MCFINIILFEINILLFISLYKLNVILQLWLYYLLDTCTYMCVFYLLPFLFQYFTLDL